ncbi:MAG: ATP-dependent DNA helicase RecG [Bacteroidia bacterium]|nr:ATP-dependent DNA helicase RecG [Bacteroidia bacterium]
MADIWDKDIMYLKKVGPKRAEVLKKECQIRTYRDLLNYFPRKYVDRSYVAKVGELQGEEHSVTLVGRITRFALNNSKRGRSILNATFTDDTGEMDLTWFQGAKWIQNSLKVGEEIAIFGKPSFYKSRFQITHPEIDWLKDDQQKAPAQIVPYYPSSEKLQRLGLDSKGIRALVKQMLAEAGSALKENLPEDFVQRHNLLGRPQALMNIHFPTDFEKMMAAKRRLKFEELFYFQILLARRRRTSKLGHSAEPFPEVGRYFLDFYEQHLPFELTGAQKRVLKEIRKDLGRPIQMNRLIQGDVGAGKTMVAFMTMLIAKDNGFQTAFMAPTAILAEQHRRKISKMGEKVGLTTAFLVGGQRKAERTQELERVKNGEADIVIGTHALIEPTVQFKKLGLAIIDEQHKFGVLQRAKLWSKASPYPHNMVMTATPIPRTLAMTVYGDIDVSVIDELPPGRKPIKTLVYGESKRLEVFGFIRSELEKGRQAYVVYPLVEESEKLDLVAAEKGFELLEKYFKGFRVGMVHGKMKPENKEFEMNRFVKNETQLLVSTTVIEVGVDVPNSTLMLIENAERFGLSQLHQLRGRVGRGQFQSYCILMAGKKLSSDGRKRLKAMRDSTDGFKISEIDLELRGPGDFLGTRQSGLPQFTIANIVEDQEILAEARDAAFEIIEKDPELKMEEHRAIKFYFERFLKSQAKLGIVA